MTRRLNGDKRKYDYIIGLVTGIGIGFIYFLVPYMSDIIILDRVPPQSLYEKY